LLANLVCALDSTSSATAFSMGVWPFQFFISHGPF